MSQLSRAINSLVELGNFIQENPEELQQIIQIAGQHNGWFDPNNCKVALESITANYLQKDQLENFVSQYEIPVKYPKLIGLILAGNIPMVGFHDILCVLLSGHNARIKLSSKDDILTKAILLKLKQINTDFDRQIEMVDRLIEYDAVIATGSNNSARYFEEYFGKKPNIIRKNRTSIAILNGNEEELAYRNLGKDLFQYYGLGCRNVSKLFVPKEYNFSPLLDSLAAYSTILNNQKYKNNLDYNLSLFLINQLPHLQGDAIILTEDKSLTSRIAVVHYEEYDKIDEVTNFIIDNKEQLQVVVGEDYTPFGQAQEPKLSDFADNIDTMKFLVELD